MDFHSLTRKELQSLSKLNKIPANITNVAMADALQSLQTVIGIEEYLNVSQSETADVVESVETVEVPSPKAPLTRCRTSTRQKAKSTETENVQSTVTRTTRRGSKQLPKEVEESKNDLLKTPAVSRTTRKATATTTRRNVNNQLNECENEPKEEGLVENRYSTRRSTRVTEKKSAAPRGKKAVEMAVNIDSFIDQENSTAEVENICDTFEKLDVEVIEEEATPESVEADEVSVEVNTLKEEADGNSVSSEDGILEDSLKISDAKFDEVSDVKPESDGISSPSEEVTYKSRAEDEDSDEVKQDLEDNLKNSEVKTDVVCDLKPDSDDVSSPCEDEDLVQNVDSENHLLSAMKEHNSVVVQEEYSDAIYTPSPCEDEKFESEENDFVMVREENSLDSDEVKQDLEDNLKNSEVKTDVVCDLKPDSDDVSSPCEDEDLVQNVDSENHLLSAMKEHNSVVVQEEYSDAIYTPSPCEDEKFESEENDFVMVREENSLESADDADMEPEDTLCVVDSEMVTDNIENPIDEITTEEMEEMSEDTTVDETVNAIPAIDDHSTRTEEIEMSEEVEDKKLEFFTENNVNDKSDEDSGPAQNPTIFSDVTGHPTHVAPFSNTSNVVSDNKENNVDEGKNRKKESLNDLSIRQLKKQLKALTLKSLDSKEEAAAGTTRSALQALCGNQMVVGGETEN